MNLKLIVTISVLVVTTAFAQTKATVADAQKVAQIITSDKAKSAAYCELGKLADRIAQAEENRDAKKSEELQKQADALSRKVGPEYIQLMARTEEIDPDSKDGKAFAAALEPLVKLCAK